MDDKGTKVLWKLPPLPQNHILLTEEGIDFDCCPESVVPEVNEIKETKRSEQAPSVKEMLPPNEQKSERTIEGEVMIWNEKFFDYEGGFHIELW